MFHHKAPHLREAIQSVIATVSGSDITADFFHVKLTVHYGDGLNAGANLYCNSRCRTDFSDLRFYMDDAVTPIPYRIEELIPSDTAVFVVSVPLIPVSPLTTEIVIKYLVNSNTGTFKIALINDMLYNSSGADGNGLTNTALTNGWVTNNFKPWCDSTFVPNLVAGVGDWIYHYSSPTNAYTDLVAIANSFNAIDCVNKAHVIGNHDKDQLTHAQIITAFGNPAYYESGKGYGSFEAGNFHIVVLDAQYSSTTPFAPLDVNTTGAGYIPDGTAGSHNQLGWLRDDLATTTKKTLIFVHQNMAECDWQMHDYFSTTSGSDASVINRAAVRAVIEASGKVIAVINGHVLWNAITIIRGIPYIAMNCFTTYASTREFSPTVNRAAWSAITIDEWAKEITIDSYEDDTVLGIRKAISHVLPYQFDDYYGQASNAYQTYRYAFSATNGLSGFDGGDYQNWDVSAKVDITMRNTLTTEPSNSGQGLKFTGTSTATIGTADRVLPSLTGKFRYTFHVNKTDITTNSDLQLMNSASIGIYLRLSSAGYLQYHNGTTFANIVAYSANTSFKIELRIDAATGMFAVYKDDTVAGTGLAFYSAQTTINKFRVSKPASQTFTLYLDDMFPSSYSTNEPQVTL